MEVLTAVIALGALSLVLATMLVAANRQLHVDEDPRIDVVEELLPHANCGACGYPGCRPFAEALVAGDVSPGLCTVGSPAGQAAIAGYLGVEVGTGTKRVARLACAGGDNVARDRARYEGPASCAAATLVGGGGKACSFGCLGLADCARACSFDAIHMDAHGLPVVAESKCTACGDCVVACPKDLFSLHAVTDRLWVRCASRAAGDVMLSDCEVACTACGRCAMDVPDVITIDGNLPVIDYARLSQTDRRAIDRCPTGAIVWIDADRGDVRGPAARKVIRRGARMEAAT